MQFFPSCLHFFLGQLPKGYVILLYAGLRDQCFTFYSFFLLFTKINLVFLLSKNLLSAFTFILTFTQSCILSMSFMIFIICLDVTNTSSVLSLFFWILPLSRRLFPLQDQYPWLTQIDQQPCGLCPPTSHIPLCFGQSRYGSLQSNV